MTTASPSASVIDSVQRLARQREAIVHELAQLSDSDCKAPAQWNNIQRNVNFLLRAFSLHELDHIQHLNKLLTGRGQQLSEAQIMLSKAQALRAELMTLLLSLSEADFDATGPNPEDWSARQLVDHLLEIDARYADNIRNSVAAARTA